MNLPGRHRRVEPKRLPRLFDREARRRRILSGAIRAFARRNFSATTTAELAATLGLSEAAIYKEFRSKRDLFLAILDEIGQGIRTHGRAQEPRGASAAEALAARAFGFLDYLATHLDEARILYQAVSEVSDARIRRKLREIYATHARDLEDILERGKREGLFREDFDSAELAWAFLSTEQAFVFSRLLGFPYFRRRESLRGVLDFALRALRRGPAARRHFPLTAELLRS